MANIRLFVLTGKMLLALSLLAAPSWADQYSQSKSKTIECFCTDRYGDRHELGDIICLSVDDRSYMAKCVMAQNVPFWRDQNRGCLSSALPGKNRELAMTLPASPNVLDALLR